MGSPSVARVFNHATRPVSIIEFKDALDAVCRPQFPSASWARQRVPALAISGGVDSMALAFLFSEYQKMFPAYRVSDYPIHVPCGIIIDHGLRAGSDEEAREVARTIRRMGLKAIVRAIRWRELRKQGVEPSELPNIESLSRKLRYWWLGVTCRGLKSPFLFTAHHQDDQYETVLMRLLSGHGYRGLQGIRGANDPPETHGLYSVHKSGMLEDQKLPNPMLNFKPTLRETRTLRNIFRDEREITKAELLTSWDSLDSIHFHGDIASTEDPKVPFLTPLNTEDGGVTLYRPLLEFGKDRLRATCEANKISWFEDHTNADETMTMRNATRHLVRNYNLPKALQKPAILSMCQRSRQRYNLEEAEARRLLIRGAVARTFDPCAGTLIIAPTSFRTRRKGPGRLHDDARDEIRKPHQRLVAALAIRNLMDFVTPEKNLPSLSMLANVVNRLFPELDPDPEQPPARPASFSIGGVFFEPILRPGTVKWLLSRAPYKSNLPVPEFFVDWREEVMSSAAAQGMCAFPHDGEAIKTHGWRKFSVPKLWDGRYWIHLASCVGERFHVRPYSPDHARAFRRALPPAQRARLAELLKHYAPGKVRTTLPAIYRADADTPRSRVDNAGLTMMALPTLGIRLDGLERWVKYEASYKKVDTTLLGLNKRGSPKPLIGYQPAVSKSRLRRRGMMRRQRSRDTQPLYDAPGHVPS